MYLTNIRGNAKRVVDFPLGRRTLFLGDNFSGKTSVAADIEFVLTGGVTGDDLGELPNRLMALAADAGDRFWAEALASDGRAFGREVTGSTIKAHKAECKPWPDSVSKRDPIGVLIDQPIQEMLRTEGRRRSGLMRLVLGRSLDQDEVLSTIPKAYHSEWQSVLNEATGKAESSEFADVLLAAQKVIASRKRATNKICKESTAAAFSAPGWSSTEEDEFVSLDGLCRTPAVDPTIAWQADRKTAEDRIAAIRAQLGKLGDFTPPTEAEIGLLHSMEAPVKAAQVVQKANESRLDCMACGGAVPKGTGATAAQLTRVKQAAGRLDDIARRATNQGSVASLQTELDRQLKVLDRPKPTVQSTGPTQVQKDRLEELRMIKRQHSEAAGHKSAAVAAEKTLLSLTALAGAVDRLVTEVLASATDKFVKSASAFLPPYNKLFLQLFDGSKAVCRVGLESTANGMQRSWGLLSRGEQWMLISALARAAARREEGLFKILRIDEVAVSVKTLGEMLEALTPEVPDDPLSQILVFAISNPTDQLVVPAGWVVNRL